MKCDIMKLICYSSRKAHKVPSSHEQESEVMLECAADVNLEVTHFETLQCTTVVLGGYFTSFTLLCTFSHHQEGISACSTRCFMHFYQL